MDQKTKTKLIEHLGGYVSKHKRELIRKVLKNRTRFITIVLEDIYQPHNASAVMRTADCLGIQDIHIIENRNQYEINPGVTLGSTKWLTINKYQSDSNKCIDNLRENGYQIVGTSPSKTHQSINEFQIEGPLALVFGTELDGLSQEVLNNVDKIVSIPMVGFTESFNISVSAAICLYHLVNQLPESKINWQLTNEEKEELTLEWYKKIVKRSDLLEQEYFK